MRGGGGAQRLPILVIPILIMLENYKNHNFFRNLSKDSLGVIGRYKNARARGFVHRYNAMHCANLKFPKNTVVLTLLRLVLG